MQTSTLCKYRQPDYDYTKSNPCNTNNNTETKQPGCDLQPGPFSAPCALVFARIHAPLLCRSITGRHGRMPAAALGPADQWWGARHNRARRCCAGDRKVRQLSAFDGICCIFFGVRAASKSFSGISTSGENGPKAASPELPNLVSRIRARAGSGSGAARARKALPARPGEPGTGPERAAAPELLRAALGTASRGVCARQCRAQTDPHRRIRGARTKSATETETTQDEGGARRVGGRLSRPGCRHGGGRGRSYGRTLCGCGRTAGRSRRGTPRRPRATARRSHGAFCAGPRRRVCGADSPA